MRQFLCLATDRDLRCEDLLTGSALGHSEEVISTCKNGVFRCGGGDSHLRGSFLGCVDRVKPLLRIFEFGSIQTVYKRIPLPETVCCGDATEDGTILALGSPSGNVHIWDIPTGKVLNFFSVGDNERISIVKFAGLFLFVVSRTAILCYTLSELIQMQSTSPCLWSTFEGHHGKIHSLCPSISEGGVHGFGLSGDTEGMVNIWDVGTGEVLGIIDIDRRDFAMCMSRITKGECFFGFEESVDTPSSLIVVKVNLVLAAEKYRTTQSALSFNAKNNESSDGLVSPAVFEIVARVVDVQEDIASFQHESSLFLEVDCTQTHILIYRRGRLSLINIHRGEVSRSELLDQKSSGGGGCSLTCLLSFCEYPNVTELSESVHPLRMKSRLAHGEDETVWAPNFEHNVHNGRLSSILERAFNHSMAHNAINFYQSCLNLSWDDRKSREREFAMVQAVWIESIASQSEQSIMQNDERELLHLQTSISKSVSLLDGIARRHNYAAPNVSVTSAMMAQKRNDEETGSQKWEKLLAKCAYAVALGGFSSEESVLKPLPDIIQIIKSQPSSYTRAPYQWIYSGNTHGSDRV